MDTRYLIICPPKSSFSALDGASLVGGFSFGAEKTDFAKLLRSAEGLFSRPDQGPPLDKLLVILSDGHGVNNEGKESLAKAVRSARANGIFIVFIILETGGSNNSVLDVQVPVYDAVTKKLMGIESYMDHFPFPFYILVREFETLPNVMGDALRQ